MGTPIIEPPSGRDCAHWDPPEETPDVVYMMYYGVKKGDDPAALTVPNGRVFKCKQSATAACHWLYDYLDGLWYSRLIIDAAQSSVVLRTNGGFPDYYFEDAPFISPVDEFHVYHNDHLTEFWDWGWNGHCIVWWSDPFLVVPHLLGLEDAPDLMIEVFNIDADFYVVKLCSKSRHTNISIKISR